MSRLNEKIAVITGGAQGVGRGVARAFAAEGATIVIANRGSDKGAAVVAELENDFPADDRRALFIQTDVGKQDDATGLIERTIAEFGRIDILVNNATPSEGMARVEHMTTEAVENHTRVNYYGSFWTMQAAFPSMKANGWGRVINMCSLNGVNAHQYTVMYNSSKEALRALTRTAAVEWGRHGITCNVLCPAAVTAPWEQFLKYDAEGAAEIVSKIPMRRMGDCEADIGPVAVFLASDESRYMTGNTIHIDGGGHINGVPWSFELPE
jgi:NAD(P)-dependent dehydrogenase (short-subunit alcohol dehydrogenase family)